MIITKADIGRKAVAKNGEFWTFEGESDSIGSLPLLFSDNNGVVFDFTLKGKFYPDGNCEYDLIRWADETEAIK